MVTLVHQGSEMNDFLKVTAKSIFISPWHGHSTKVFLSVVK